MAQSLLIFSCSLYAPSSLFNFFCLYHCLFVCLCVSISPGLFSLRSAVKDEAWEGQNPNPRALHCFATFWTHFLCHSRLSLQ